MGLVNGILRSSLSLSPGVIATRTTNKKKGTKLSSRSCLCWIFFGFVCGKRRTCCPSVIYCMYIRAGGEGRGERKEGGRRVPGSLIHRRKIVDCWR